MKADFSMSSRFIFRMLFSTALLLSCSAVDGAENPMDCVEEITMPSITGGLMTSIPATVEIRVLIGEHGMAREVDYGNARPVFRLELDEYFRRKTRYLGACNGKTIRFKIRYVVEGNRTSRPVSEVRFRPPNEFIVLCHPVEPALDPFPHLKSK
jgi:hypothetical protein